MKFIEFYRIYYSIFIIIHLKMLTTYVLEEEANNTNRLNKTVSTGISGSPLNSDLQKAQLEADEHIKQLIKLMFLLL